MPWIIAGAALVGTIANQQQGAQAKRQANQATAMQAAQNKPRTPAFTPTATSAQQSMAPPEAMEMASGPSPTSSPPPQTGQQGGGAGNTLANVNNMVQMGATLQSIFQNEKTQRQNAMGQALASAPRPGAMGAYQPTAGRMMDPRLSQIYGGR